MADPVLTPGSWLQFLERKVDAQAEAIDVYEDYFNGEQRLAFATMKFREAFSRFFPPMADNWMKLVVQAPVSRLVVQGFRFDPDPTKPTWEMEADRDAWEIWQASNFDAASRIVHTEAVKSGTAYVLVSPPSEPGGWPQLTPEAASQVYVYLDPANRRRRLAAIKKWVSELDGMAYANVYLPDVIFKWVSQATYREGMKISWQRRPDDPGGRNPIGVVPLVPLENEPDLLCGGRSDLEAAIPIQDAVNKFCLDMQVSSEYHAFPQRYATGWERATDDVGNELTGREVELAAGQSRLWRAESTDTQFGQLAPGDVNNYIAPIELYIDHLAAVTQTPAYYLKGKMANLPLAMDTIVPTPSGRTTMGDLKAGDDVFAPDGTVVRVAKAHPIRYGRDCYRVKFDDGTEIVADGDHRWQTSHFTSPENPYSRRKNREERETSIVTTAEIAESVKTSIGTYNHFIPVAEAHVGPTLQYPIAPYTLGAWLGDGSRGLAEITAHASDAPAMAERLRSTGETVAVRSYPETDAIHRDTRTLSLTRDYDRCFHGHERPRGSHDVTHHCRPCAHLHYRRRKYGEPLPAKVNTTFKSRLRLLGVLDNKHIPEQYFRGSPEQRLALLQGVMDTDGTVNRDQGGVALTLHDERLARDVHRLAQSLGHKVALRKREWRRRDSALVKAGSGTCWRMSWTPPQTVFCMERKAELQRLPAEGGDGRSSSPFRRYIISCERTKTVPVRCIAVASDEHLFCITDAFVVTPNSADALHAADQGLVDRVRSKLLSLGDGWEEVMRTAFLAKGDKARGHATTAETIWADPETKSLGQLVDAAAKLRQVLSVPLEMCWQLLGWSPEQIRQAREMAAQPALPEAPGAPQVLGPDGMPLAAIPSSLPAPVPPPPGQGQLASIPTRA